MPKRKNLPSLFKDISIEISLNIPKCPCCCVSIIIYTLIQLSDTYDVKNAKRLPLSILTFLETKHIQMLFQGQVPIYVLMNLPENLLFLTKHLTYRLTRSRTASLFFFNEEEILKNNATYAFYFPINL